MLLLMSLFGFFVPKLETAWELRLMEQGSLDISDVPKRPAVLKFIIIDIDFCCEPLELCVNEER